MKAITNATVRTAATVASATAATVGRMLVCPNFIVLKSDTFAFAGAVA
jgi:hypothetical protein